ncbi:MAG: hypothetical protein IKZ73_05630 [Lachnospiraceae bacterium]|nr:hypothetical protein [Lachnospiraceae bacterium]
MNMKQTLRQANLTKWSNLFHEQRSSGLSVKDWCAQNNVTIHAFYYWKRLAKEAYVKSLIPDIVPLTPPSVPERLPDPQVPSHDLCNLRNSSDTQETNVPRSDSITISADNIKIEISASASDELITRIIKAVRYA